MAMKNFICAIFILLSFNIAYAQDSSDTSYVDKKDFHVEIQKIKESIMQLRKSNTYLKDTVAQQNKNIIDLRNIIETKEENIKKNVATVKQETKTKILDIDQKIWVRTVLWIVIMIVISMLCGFVFIILRKKLVLSSKTLDDQITTTREILEREGIKLDNKLMEVLETQFQILKNQTHANMHQESEVDHSLALRVGEEIHRMRKRIENMAESTKGIGALKNSLMRLEEEFNENGYEIIELTGKPYNDNIIANMRFTSSDELKIGENIISKVIKPQINYKGVLIKAADIEVSSGG